MEIVSRTARKSTPGTRTRPEPALVTEEEPVCFQASSQFRFDSFVAAEQRRGTRMFSGVKPIPFRLVRCGRTEKRNPYVFE